VGRLTAAMLLRGTRNKTRQQIQDESDRLKARLDVDGGATDVVATIETVEASLAGSLRLAAEVLHEPAFPESEFIQLQQQEIAAAEANKSEPLFLGRIELQRHLISYPPGHVLHVESLDERIENLKKVTLEDVRQYYAQFYGASSAKFVVSGQFDLPATQKLASELLGSWKSPSSFTRIPNSYQKVQAIDFKIETPDKQNALLMAGMNVKLPDDDPDYPSVIIANYIFGGSGGSRLFKRIRDKEGLSYGVGSQFNVPQKDNGARFVVFGISNPQNAAKLEASLRDELARTVKDGFTAEEVAAAKKSWLDEQMVNRSQDRALLVALMQCERFDRTLKWQETLEARVTAVTPEQVSAAFRRYVDPATMSYVKAGDFKRAGVFQ
jgi:zinc protease